MKQLRSTSHTTTRLAKKPILLSFKQTKTISKIQQITSNNKSQIYFNVKIIPIEVVAEKKNGEIIKVIVNNNDVVVQDGGKVFKVVFNIGTNIQVSLVKVWFQINFGEVCNNVKVKKIGDQNVFGGSPAMVSWDYSQSQQKKKNAIINIKEIVKGNQKQIQYNHNPPISQNKDNKDDKNKQMRAFVANLMSKKVNRRSSQNNQFESKTSLRKRPQIFKSKIIGCQQLVSQNCFNVKPPSTATTILSGISGVKSFRNQIINCKNLLKESKFTEKQTSVGDQSLFLNQKANVNLAQLSSLQNQNYDKKKMKFDSQPYFYQKSTLTSHFSKNNQSTKNIEYSRQQKPTYPTINKTMDLQFKIQKQKQQVFQTFDNQSQHKSEQQQVEQDIKRSEMINSSLKNSQEQQLKGLKKEKDQQSSQCFESKQIESSGTIYQSRYQ